MFDVIYIEKSLCRNQRCIDSDHNTYATDLLWMQAFLQQNPNGKIEYLESPVFEAGGNENGFAITGLSSGKAVLVGETKYFLEQGQMLHIPVLAVLTKENEDLFSFPYAVSSLSDITLDYLELIQCRYEKRPYTIAKTQRLRIVEMDEVCAIEYFSLKEAEPELFLLDTDRTAKSKQEIEECARAYISHVYPFYGYGIWAVYEKETGCLVGFAGVEKLDNQEGALNLSYYIKKEYRRNGYAIESCQAILTYVKEELQEMKMYCMIAADNLPSLAVAEKIDVEIHII